MVIRTLETVKIETQNLYIILIYTGDLGTKRWFLYQKRINKDHCLPISSERDLIWFSI